MKFAREGDDGFRITTFCELCEKFVSGLNGLRIGDAIPNWYSSLQVTLCRRLPNGISWRNQVTASNGNLCDSGQSIRQITAIATAESAKVCREMSKIFNALLN